MAAAAPAQNRFSVIHDVVKKILYEEASGTVAVLFGKFEKVSKRKREELVYGVSALLSLYLLFGHFAELVCNLIGFAYPAYASFVAVETPDKTDDTQWLIYWVVFAVFSLVDFWAKLAMKYVPFYWLAKCAFLLYLYLPFSRGALHHYEKHLRPIFNTYGVMIVEKLSGTGTPPKEDAEEPENDPDE